MQVNVQRSASRCHRHQHLEDSEDYSWDEGRLSRVKWIPRVHTQLSRRITDQGWRISLMLRPSYMQLTLRWEMASRGITSPSEVSKTSAVCTPVAAWAAASHSWTISIEADPCRIKTYGVLSGCQAHGCRIHICAYATQLMIILVISIH